MRLTTTVGELQPGDVLIKTARTVDAVRPGRGDAIEVTLREPTGQWSYAVWQARMVITIERAEEVEGV